MKFQPRDGEILWAIYNYDGVVALRHLKEMYWKPDDTDRAVEKVILRLVREHYIARPSDQHKKTKAIPEPIYWLGWNGILWIAGQMGLGLKEPANTGENQMRLLRKRLLKQGIRWLREPHWNQLSHDLTVVDFRRAVEGAIGEAPSLTLVRWINESVFRSDKDYVEFQMRTRDGRVTQKEYKKLLGKETQARDFFYHELDEWIYRAGQLKRKGTPEAGPSDHEAEPYTLEEHIEHFNKFKNERRIGLVDTLLKTIKNAKRDGYNKSTQRLLEVYAEHLEATQHLTLYDVWLFGTWEADEKIRTGREPHVGAAGPDPGLANFDQFVSLVEEAMDVAEHRPNMPPSSRSGASKFEGSENE